MLSSNIFSTRKLLRRGGTLGTPSEFQRKLQIKCQEKKVT